jgi:hypothetical protein
MPVPASEQPEVGGRGPLPDSALQKAEQPESVVDLDVSAICADSVSGRADLNRDHIIADYIEPTRRGEMPPVVVHYDGEKHWLARGFLRLEAAKRAGCKTIKAIVKPGTRRDAILEAAGANATHGLRRTIADKWRAVSLLLKDPEWARWNDSEIARRCHVSNHLVAEVRVHLGTLQDNPSGDQDCRTVNRNGTTYPMDTSNIGKGRKGNQAPEKPAPTNGCFGRLARLQKGYLRLTSECRWLFREWLSRRTD